MARDLKKQADSLARDVRRLGYTVKKTGNGEYGIYLPDTGKFISSFSGTPSAYTAIPNARAQLKRMGILEGEPVGAVKAKLERKAEMARLTPVPVELANRLERIALDLGYQPGKRGPGNATLAHMVRHANTLANGDWQPGSEHSGTDLLRKIMNGQKNATPHGVAYVERLVNDLDRGGTLPPKAPAGIDQKNVKVKRVPAVVTRWWECPVCLEKFESESDLRLHRNLTHPKQVAEEVVEEMDKYLSVSTIPGRPTEKKADLYHNDLHMRVLAAILDPSVDRTEALEISEEVRQAIS